MPESQPSEGNSSRSSKSQFETGMCYSRRPYDCPNRHAALS